MSQYIVTPPFVVAHVAVFLVLGDVVLSCPVWVVCVQVAMKILILGTAARAFWNRARLLMVILRVLAVFRLSQHLSVW
jgi:hypothetical protein